jgi:hypothetical protein
MLKKLVIAMSVAGALAAGPPAAHAALVRSGCGIAAADQETVTGGQDVFAGAAYGYAVFDDQGTHTVRCYVTVDGVPAAGGSTAPQSGTGAVATAGEVTYFAAEGSSVDVCTEVDGVTVACRATTESQVPPQMVFDALDAFCATLHDLGLPPNPYVCPPYLAAEVNELIP